MAASALAMTGSLMACSHSASREDVSKTSQATAQVGAEEYMSVSFDKGSAVLSSSDKEKLRTLATRAQGNGKVDEYKVLAWADKEFPAAGQKATRGDIELAKARAQSIERFFEDEMNSSVDVEGYNMAERPGALSNLFNTSDAKVKQTFESAGAAPTATGVIGNKASQALILVDYED